MEILFGLDRERLIEGMRLWHREGMLHWPHWRREGLRRWSLTVKEIPVHNSVVETKFSRT